MIFHVFSLNAIFGIIEDILKVQLLSVLNMHQDFFIYFTFSSSIIFIYVYLLNVTIYLFCKLL